MSKAITFQLQTTFTKFCKANEGGFFRTVSE